MHGNHNYHDSFFFLSFILTNVTKRILLFHGSPQLCRWYAKWLTKAGYHCDYSDCIVDIALFFTKSLGKGRLYGLFLYDIDCFGMMGLELLRSFRTIEIRVLQKQRSITSFVGLTNNPGVGFGDVCRYKLDDLCSSIGPDELMSEVERRLGGDNGNLRSL